MKAVIMAGGDGTRLRPLTENVPKPLVKLCGRQALLYILDLLDSHGVTDALITLRYKGDMIEELFPKALSVGGMYIQRYRGIRLRFSYEDKPLGTAGCIRKAADDEDTREFFADKKPFLS